MRKLLIALLALALPLHAESRRPNLVLIVVDDLGYGDIGPFGSTKNRTPHLDRLAAEGAKLTSFYAAPSCTASRAQTITGSYAQRVSLPRVLFPASPIGLSADEPTIASVLKSAGYASIAIGKWHLGDHPDYLPTARGFDSWFGLPYSNDMYLRPGREERHRFSPPLPLVRDAEVIETVSPEQQSRLTERYTDAALHFIRTNKEHPFLLYLAHTAVHTPIHPGEKFRGKSNNGRFGDWVEEVDWSVGRILDTLRETSLDRDTLLVFTSDNGPWLTQGSDGGEAGPLRGGKGGTYEGGVRVPTLAWWPGKIPAGRSIGAIAANFDLLPTFAELADATLPESPPIDGKSLAPLLLGQTDESPRDTHYYYAGDQLQAVRSGPWKLALGRQNEATGKPHPDASKPFSPTLYHLEDDIGETTDLAGEHPDIVARLQKLAGRAAADLGATRPGPGVRPPGRIKLPAGLWLPGHGPTEEELKLHHQGKPLSDLKPGDTLISRHAPQIARKTLAIKITVAPEAPDGIILAQGGTAAGYALHLHQGVPVFTVRDSDKTVSIRAGRKPDRVPFALEAKLEADGTLTLAIDGEPAARGQAPGLISRQPAEDFALGHDNGRPVADYQGAGPFRGALTGLEITTTDPS